MNLVFMKCWLPVGFRPAILRSFAADIGKRIMIRHRLRVFWPSELSAGACWIGEDAWFRILEPTTSSTTYA